MCSEIYRGVDILYNLLTTWYWLAEFCILSLAWVALSHLLHFTNSVCYLYSCGLYLFICVALSDIRTHTHTRAHLTPRPISHLLLIDSFCIIVSFSFYFAAAAAAVLSFIQHTNHLDRSTLIRLIRFKSFIIYVHFEVTDWYIHTHSHTCHFVCRQFAIVSLAIAVAIAVTIVFVVFSAFVFEGFFLFQFLPTMYVLFNCTICIISYIFLLGFLFTVSVILVRIN